MSTTPYVDEDGEPQILADGRPRNNFYFTQQTHFFMELIYNTCYIPHRKPWSQHAYFFLPLEVFRSIAIGCKGGGVEPQRFDEFDPNSIIAQDYRRLLCAFATVASMCGEASNDRGARPPSLDTFGEPLSEAAPRYTCTVTTVEHEEEGNAPVGFVFVLSYTEIRLTHAPTAPPEEQWDKSQDERDVLHLRESHRPGLEPDDAKWEPDFGEQDPLTLKWVRRPDSDAKIEKKLRMIEESRNRRRPDWILASWLEANDMRHRSRRSQVLSAFGRSRSARAVSPGREIYEDLRRVDWANCAMKYCTGLETTGAINYEDYMNGNLRKSGCQGNFFRVFSLDRACKSMRRKHAHPDYSNESVWPDNWQEIKIAHGEEARLPQNHGRYPRNGRGTRRVEPHELEPRDRLAQTVFPHLDPGTIDITTPQFKQLMADCYEHELEGAPKDGIARMDAPVWTRPELEVRALHAAVGRAQSSSSLYARDLNALKRKISESFKLAGKDKKAIFAARIKGLMDFAQMFTAHGRMPDAYCAIASYVAKNINNRDHRFGQLPNMAHAVEAADLSYYGESKALEGFEAERLGMYVAHSELAMVRAASFTVGDHLKNFKPCVLVSGDFARGKSHTLQELKQEMIPGTYDVRSSVSSKVDNQNTNAHLNGKIWLNEEIQPTVLGITAESRHHSKTGGMDQGQSDQANQNRDRMTRQKITFARLEQDPETRGFFTNLVDMDCKIWEGAATNLPKDRIPPNTRSRWFVVTYQHETRDGLTMPEAKAAYDQQKKRQGPREKNPMREGRNARTRRDQAFIFIINQLIYLGLVPPVFTQLTDALMLHILNKATKSGLSSCQDIRPSERINMTIEVSEAIRHAIALEFDSGMYGLDAPQDTELGHFQFVDGKTYTHMTMWLKLLRCCLRLHSTVEQLVFMLSGFGPHTYEDPAGYVVCDAINQAFQTQWCRKKRPKEKEVRVGDPGMPASMTPAVASAGSSSRASASATPSRSTPKQTTIGSGFDRQQQQQQQRPASIGVVAPAATSSSDEGEAASPALPHYQEFPWKDDRKNPTAEERANQLAKFLKQHFVKASPLDHCAYWIRGQMEEFQVVKDGETSQQLKNIVFTDDSVKVATNLLCSARTGRLKSAIRGVLEDVIPHKQTFLLGTTDANHPYYYEKLEVVPRPVPPGKKKKGLKNLEYIPPDLRAFAERYKKLLQAEEDESEAQDKKEQEEREHNREYAERIAAERLRDGRRHIKRIIIDSDPDDESAARYLEQWPDIIELFEALHIKTTEEQEKWFRPSKYNAQLHTQRPFAKKASYYGPPQGKRGHGDDRAISMLLSELRSPTEARKRQLVGLVEAEASEVLKPSSAAEEARQRHKRYRESKQPSPSAGSSSMDVGSDESKEGKDEKKSETKAESTRRLVELSITESMRAAAADEPPRRPKPRRIRNIPSLFETARVVPANGRNGRRPRGNDDGFEISDAAAQREDDRNPAEEGWDPRIHNMAVQTRRIDERRRARAQTPSLLQRMQRHAEAEFGADDGEDQVDFRAILAQTERRKRRRPREATTTEGQSEASAVGGAQESEAVGADVRAEAEAAAAREIEEDMDSLEAMQKELEDLQDNEPRSESSVSSRSSTSDEKKGRRLQRMARSPSPEMDIDEDSRPGPSADPDVPPAPASPPPPMKQSKIDFSRFKLGAPKPAAAPAPPT